MDKTISACILTKNSEETIENCLKSIQNLVDDIVIVDTGSTDNTKKIAKEYNAKIYDFEWDDDFSKARNFSLNLIHTDWVLIIDSDEELVTDKETLKNLINKESERIPMYFIDIFTRLTWENKKKYKYYQKKLRLFPLHENIVFENSIYEEIVHPKGTNNLKGISAKGIAIRHYLKDGLKSKTKRNIEILKKEISQKPNSFYYNYLLGQECFQSNYLSKALTFYQRALDSQDEKDEVYISEISTNIIKILYKQGNSEEALNECIRREKVCSINPEYWLTYGYIALKEGDMECAKNCIKTCLSMSPPSDSLLINIDNITWKPEILLGYINLRQKDYKNAKIYFEKALNSNQNYWLLLFYLGMTCKNLKDYNSAEAYFKASEFIIPDEFRQELKFNLMLMYIMNGNIEKANQTIKEIVDEFAIEEEDELQLLDYEGFENTA